MPRPFDSLRRRVEQSETLARTTGGAVAGWTRFSNRTTRWDRHGEDEVTAAVAQGPVIMVLWHEMLMMGSIHWRPEWGRLATLHDASPGGRAGAATQQKLGATPFLVSSKQSNMGLTRDVLGLIRGGTSLAIAGDGPRGPRRVLKDPPLDWARAAGVPVFAYAWAIAGQVRARSWDRLILPRPFARGAIVFRRWDREVPRRTDAAGREALRADLTAHLNATAQAAEALVRRNRDDVSNA
jgi:lysophospholipid acyltransferase (LPLAT)-like uncharacterized protein